MSLANWQFGMTVNIDRRYGWFILTERLLENQARNRPVAASLARPNQSDRRIYRTAREVIRPLEPEFALDPFRLRHLLGLLNSPFTRSGWFLPTPYIPSGLRFRLPELHHLPSGRLPCGLPDPLKGRYSVRPWLFRAARATPLRRRSRVPRGRFSPFLVSLPPVTPARRTGNCFPKSITIRLML